MKASFALTAGLASILAHLSTASPLEARDQTVNPFLGKEFYVPEHWTSEVNGAVASLTASGQTALAAKAQKVASVSTFLWVSDRAAVTTIYPLLKAAQTLQKSSGKKQVAQIVVYDLPNRDCSAGASGGEFTVQNAGVSRYEAYIKAIYSEIQRVPDVQVVLVVEPDSIGNIVTNQSVPKCAEAAPAYKHGIAFAIATLSKLSNVAIYVDAAHAGWLGWPGNIGPTAQILGDILTAAKAIWPGATVRGVSTNVSNYNGLGTQPAQGGDDLVYAQNLAPLLTAVGYPAHFIVDQGRAGVQNYTRAGTDWCNNKYAGFGMRPTTATPDPVIDAIVWVKPGGESDGSSDASTTGYDPACGNENALIPAPLAGTWFETYFEQLVRNANPSF